MRTTVEDATLTIYLEGDVDSTNASSLEAQATDAIKANPGASVVVDVSDVTSISADGLCMLVRLQQQVGASITVANVAPEALPTFLVPSFTQIMNVYPRIREISVEVCEMIGSGASASCIASKWTPSRRSTPKATPWRR